VRRCAGQSSGSVGVGQRTGDARRKQTAVWVRAQSSVCKTTTPDILGVFQLALAVAMGEHVKAQPINPAQLHGPTPLTFTSAAGDAFSMVKPEAGAVLEARGRDQSHPYKRAIPGRKVL
jgi:hypothetical protein